MLSNNTIRITAQDRQTTRGLSWLGWTAFCLSLLWHGAIFHILSPTLSCPWVSDAGTHSNPHLVQKTLDAHYSAEETIPTYLISSNSHRASTTNPLSSSELDPKKATPASEPAETQTNAQKENNHHVYELNAQAMGWKISAPVMQYPTAALSKQQQGTVILQASLNQKRGFDNIHILHSSGVSELDQAAITWFKKVKLIPIQPFSPKFGSLFTQTIQFQLKS